MGEADLEDVVLSWSLQEINDDDLYAPKVETIPCKFKSLDHYLAMYRVPLIEETRSDLCSCLELVSQAPSSKILSMEIAGKSGPYFMDVDFWDNDAGFSTGAYSARSGDIFILSSIKSEAAEDLNSHGVTYCLAMVTEVSMDDEYQKGFRFRVKVEKNINLEEDLIKLKHAIFLNNITTNIRVWKALTFDAHMNENFTVIKSLLAPTNLGEDICGVCVKQDGGCLASFTEQLLSVKLNQSQVDAIESVISAVQCGHVNLMKLIWGPPGTGKTKTVSALLWVLACLKCRTLTCAPTNVAVVGVCTHFLQNLKDFNQHTDNIVLPFSLGDILLFGSRSNMDITKDLQEVFLDFRVDKLVECFSSLSGWNSRIASMISFFEDSASRYDMLLQDDGKTDPVCFLDFIKKQFDATAIALKRCIMNLWVHLPGRCFSRDSAINISTLLHMLENFGALLCDVDLTDEGLKRGLGCLSTENSVCAQPISSIEKELDGARSTCLKLLKDLLHSLNLPTGVDKSWVQNYCICNATLLFCTTSSSYRLHHMEIAPLDVLIVDEAAQVRECELVIPLRLHWLKHVVLVGDDCQLSAMVKSKVCKEAGFATSLFERLVMLKFDKHLLNIQYRMNPCISLFPNAQFYERKILDGFNVLSPSYNKDYTCLPFGSYTFINLTDGREDKEGVGNSCRNMVEVAVVLHLIHTIFKSWKRTDQGLSIGVVSPYNAQVDAIKSQLGKKYDTCDGFHVQVMSIDGFQGEEDDIVILSTVRSNGRGIVGFLADNRRTNVALTRARHCLWIVGNAHTLYKSGTEWTDLIADAERRKCIFSATNDATICKLVLQVKQELDELEDLLNADSAVFSNTRWKVILSDEFRKSFTKLKSPQLRKEVLQKLIKLGDGWRTTVKNLDMPGVSHLVKVYNVWDLYLVWSTDVEKTERTYSQIIRIWDLLSQQNVARTVQRLENLFSMYTDDYLDHCRRVQTQGKLEVPIVWDIVHDIIRYSKDCKVDSHEERDLVDTSYAMENSKVSESFLLMKFYSLSSGMAKHLLTATDGSEINVPFELTDEEQVIIQFPLTSFVLGRSGTGKTTVLTMKLIQKEQQSLIASQGLNLDGADLSGVDDNNIMPPKNGGESSVKQVFITVSPKLCSAIKDHICRLKRFGTGDVCDQPSILHMHDIMDDLEEFTEIPDSFCDLPHGHYPLTITYRKFFMMLDGTCQTSFFDAFYGEMKSSFERGHSRSRAVQTFIELKEVTYEKFVTFYWPRFNANLTKKFAASTVYTEIISHIKGAYQASRPGKLGRQDYVMLADKRFSSLNNEKRDRIYDIFLEYESMKCTAREFDLSDFINSLHSSLVSEGYNGDMVDFVYIDEVQDLTMTQIALLKYVCMNIKEGFLFAGDTAQTIARGIDFRFEDIRSLFYTAFLAETEASIEGLKHGKRVHLSDMFQLSQNFRTHSGILQTGLVHGEAPVLLESDNDENAIMTIFGESKSKHGNLHGFGAEQVILVRDDATKKQIIDIVGKQALVLTIVECKGLEFQDVLLYNFFGSSPLRTKWRVLYGYMEDKDIIAHSEEISHPGFDRSKHYLLCSELKQLYVANTRTRQRLWICENTDDYCRPMFDYWKKLCLVEVRLLDSPLIQAMQTGSSSDDWRLRGIKLFNEGQFEMATMCFEKAGDVYREKWARASGLLATADHVISTNLELGKASLQTASEIYESTGMHEKAATCYIKLADYKKAGMVYMQKCGTSRLEDAGDCFAKAECWSEAAEMFLKAKCYTKCFSMCSKGKQLYNLGLQFLQQLEEEHSLENSNSLEVSAIRTKYLDNCAQHYFERGDIKNMMPFVKAFSSMDHVRTFLNSRDLVDELLSLEMEMGNFLEAAGIAKHKGDVLLEVDILEKADLFEDATRLLLLRITVDSLWSSNSRGWPLKRYPEKAQLLAKAKEMAKNVSECFYCFVCVEADALSGVNKSLSSLSCTFLEGRKCANLLVELVASRSILDVHLQSRTSGYKIELGPGSEDENSCNDMLASNQMSPQTLFYAWNHWKSIIIKVLSHLRHTNGPELNDYAVVCEDLCAKYFGLRKDGEVDRYVVLNMNASWLSNAGRNSLQQDSNRYLLGAPECHSYAQCFWMNELSSVGFSVLKKLESIVQISPKPVSSYTLVRTILIIHEIGKLLEEPLFSMPKGSMKLRNFFVLCERRFFELVFLLWRDGAKGSLLHLLDSPAAYGLIADSLSANLRPANKKLTHGHLGRTTMLLLHAAQLDEALLSRLLQYIGNNSEWADFFRYFKRFLDSGCDRSSLILNFKLALEFTFSVKWKDELDYISPLCYVSLMECLGFLASSYLVQNEFICCTKSLLVNMLECRTSKAYIESCLVSNSSLDSDLDRWTNSSGRFIYETIMTILTTKHMLQEWVQKTSCPSSTSYKAVLLRIVVTLYPLIITLSLGNCYEVTRTLVKNEVFKDLPLEFSKKIEDALKMRPRTRSDFTRVLADALATIGNHMVFIGSPKGPAICRNLNAYMISKEDLHDVPKIMALLYIEEPSSVKQETPLPEKSDGSKFGNPVPVEVLKIESSIQTDSSDDMFETLWKKFETFRLDVEGHKDSRVVIQFFRDALPWLEQSGLLAVIDKQVDEHNLEAIKHICSEFEKLPDRTARNAVDDLFSKWQGSEKALEVVFRLVYGTRHCMDDCLANHKSKDGCREKGKFPGLTILKVPTASIRNACPDDERADMGEAASTSAKVGQKQKGKKKSKRMKKPDKGRGKK
ncbi:Lupus brain antigen 1-like protein [Hordeum vulgare]|nr:Lupus brain antigen 1-like protein [Hordeum vulgare]